MANFKVGDRVRITEIYQETGGYEKFVGQEGVITQLNHDRDFTYPVTVELDSPYTAHQVFKDDELELVESYQQKEIEKLRELAGARLESIHAMSMDIDQLKSERDEALSSLDLMTRDRDHWREQHAKAQRDIAKQGAVFWREKCDEIRTQYDSAIAERDKWQANSNDYINDLAKKIRERDDAIADRNKFRDSVDRLVRRNVTLADENDRLQKERDGLEATATGWKSELEKYHKVRSLLKEVF